MAVFSAILPGRQSGQKVQFSYRNRLEKKIPFSIDFAQHMKLNFNIIDRRLYFKKFEGRNWAKRRSVDF